MNLHTLAQRLGNREPLRSGLVALALLAITAAVYGPAIGHDFINLDDQMYVTGNPAVRDGFTRSGIMRAFGFMAGNWHPLTWLSHMLDAQLFGLHPWGHHLVSVLLHGAAAVALFVALRGLTGALWRSALVAALFAVHPLNVESVAWVAERKNVLCTLFLWLTIGAWRRYLQRPAPPAGNGLRAAQATGRYMAALALYALALMAKPMAVTLPFLLLLLDWWPLGRFRGTGGGTPSSRAATAGRLLLEKLPFAALAAAVSVLTWFAQYTAPVELFLPPLSLRAANAVVSLGAYLLKMVWPARLAVLYPYPIGGIPSHLIAGSALLLAAITMISALRLRRQPYLSVGWCWYLGTLVPVIGLVHSGAQSRADRYTYIPLVGIFLALVWLAAELAAATKLRRRAGAAPAALIAAAALIGLAALAVTAERQSARWRDSLTLMAYSARVTKDNAMILNNLGSALMERNRLEEAQGVLEEVLRIRPDHVNAIFNLATVFKRRGQSQKAVALFHWGLRYAPDNLDARYDLAMVLLNSGRLAEAAQHLNYLYRLNPSYPNVRFQLAVIQDRIRRDPRTEPPDPGR